MHWIEFTSTILFIWIVPTVIITITLVSGSNTFSTIGTCELWWRTLNWLTWKKSYSTFFGTLFCTILSWIDWVYLDNFFHLSSPHSHCHHRICKWIEHILYHWHIWTVMKNIELKKENKKSCRIIFFWDYDQYFIVHWLSLPVQFLSSELSPQSSSPSHLYLDGIHPLPLAHANSVEEHFLSNWTFHGHSP